MNTGGGDWIGALIGLGTAIYTADRQKAAQERQNQYNVDAANTAWERNLQMWNMMNDYNSPMSQMERYRMAGLNPNMVGQSGTGSGNASSLPHYNAPTAEFRAFPVDFAGVLGMYQNFQMKKQQIDNLKAQNDYIKQQTVNKGLEALGIPYRNQNIQLTGENLGYTGSKIRAGTAAVIAANERAQGLYPYQSAILQEEARRAPLRTSHLGQQLLNLQSENTIKQINAQLGRGNLTMQQLQQERVRQEIIFKKFENEWRAKGVTSSDNIAVRAATKMMSEGGLLSGDWWHGPGSDSFEFDSYMREYADELPGKGEYMYK